MENYSTGLFIQPDHLELPPGFRFHPKDEELITHYLSKKVADVNFSPRAIGVIDMNRVEPWDLLTIAKKGEHEWYFFCVRDKKYPTGLRTNRATAAGYWKATGKDKEIMRGKSLVGMKKTLVFYKGRAPKGIKTNWVCKEFRLDGKSSINNLPQSAQNDWVIAKVFEKKAGEKELIPSNPPPLMDSPSFIGSTISTTAAAPETGSVHCFSTSSQEQEQQQLNYSELLQRGTTYPIPNGYPSLNWDQFQTNYQYQGLNSVQNDGIFGGLFENYGQNMKQSMKTEARTIVSGSQETSLITTDVNAEISSVLSNLEMGGNYNQDQEGPLTFGGIQGSDYLWNY